MQFTKIRSTELKHSTVTHFCIQSYDNNMIVENPVMEAVFLNLNNEPDIAELFPFTITSVEIPQEKFASDLLKGVNLRRLYAKCTTEEQQEFGLDPMFVAECCIEPAKSRLLQAQYLPSTKTAQSSMLAIVSTYGVCHILARNPYNRLWDRKVGDLNERLASEVFPMEKSPNDLESFKELKDFINLYVITACTWHSCETIIYAANAAGFIIAFKHEEDNAGGKTWLCLSKISTDIGRISYLKSFDNYLVAVSISGIIQLFKLNNTHVICQLEELEALETLWGHEDRISCRQIMVQKSKSDGGYAILFAKSSHIVCTRISDEGKLEGSSSLYVPGIKITGIELFHDNELIVTTINGNVLRITFTCLKEKGCFKSLRLKADKVTLPNMDTENYQILGVGATNNKALWIFMTDRKKELPVSAKTAVLPSHLVLCKPNTIDPLAQLNNIPIDTMDRYQDLILALRMDVWQSNITEKYNHRYAVFADTSLQRTLLDETLLQNMQIQLEIARAAFRRSIYKLQIMNEIISSEIEFLELGTQITHILLRLEYLQSHIDNARMLDESAEITKLTAFQRRAVYAMRKHFYIFIDKLKEVANKSSKKDEINQFKEVILNFVKFAFRNWHAKCQDFEIIDTADLEEECLVCNERLAERELMCCHGHNMKRCCVSFVQLPWLNNRFCQQCGTMALDSADSHDLLAELFPPNESVKCTFCRFTFSLREIL